MPGFLMGLLQFGWLGVNACIVSEVLCRCFGVGVSVDKSGVETVLQPGLWHGLIASVFAIVAAFVGLKGIRYVGRVGTYLPLIPIVILIVLLVICWSGVSKYQVGKYFTPAAKAEHDRQVSRERQAELERQMQLPEDETADLESEAVVPPKKFVPHSMNLLTEWQVMQILIIYVVGFFATAGAAVPISP